MAKPVLGYWNIRGYAQPIRLLLRYAEVDFEDKVYNLNPNPPTYGAEEWFNEKFNHGLDFPNVPYFKDGDIKLTQSKAILHYVARNYTNATLWLPANLEDEARVEMVIGVLEDVQRTLAHLTYDVVSPWDRPIEEATAQPFQHLMQYLGSNEWLFGDRISYVDFLFYEVIKKYKLFRSDFFKSQPILESYIERFEAIPQLSEYIKSIEGKLLCWSPAAKLKY